MNRLVSTSGLVVALMLLGLIDMTAHREPAAQTPETDIRNFRAVDVSSAELRVTVDYTYAGELGQGGGFIHATPEESGGVFDPRTVEFEELPLRPGTFTVTLTITRREASRDFASVAVRVCMSTTERALICRDFPHQKRWTAATPNPPDPAPIDPPSPPDPPAPPTLPPAQQTCSISGQLSGPLQGLSYPDHPGPPSRVRLRYMQATADGKPAVFVPVTNRRYSFTKLPAGVVYRVSPSWFQSAPRNQNVRCRANTRHHVDFRIIGPMPEG